MAETITDAMVEAGLDAYYGAEPAWSDGSELSGRMRAALAAAEQVRPSTPITVMMERVLQERSRAEKAEAEHLKVSDIANELGKERDALRRSTRLDQWRLKMAEAERNEARALADKLADDAKMLLRVIDAAGLLNLSNGVQLGQTSWYVKASDRCERLRVALAEHAATRALMKEPANG